MTNETSLVTLQSRLTDRIWNCIPVTEQAFYKLLGLLEIRCSTRIPTACVTMGSRSSLLINPEFVTQHCRTDPQLSMLVMHISKTGFINGPILVPRFVLNELQHIADSSDPTRRSRGRRGLEILNKLQKESSVPVQVTNVDVDGVREVDDKLVALAKQLHCPVVTNDYNLSHVAELQGVTVLNINELANAVRVVCLPGEKMEISIIQDGKEKGQGVGYLEDGTMVVVDEGHQSMNNKLRVVVTKVLQTSAGRMLFARPDEKHR